MFFRPWVYVMALIVIIALIAVMQPETEGEQLPVIGEIPAFSLVDQDGDRFTLDNVKGNVWLADFIFTTCSGPCPIMTERMSMVQHDLLEIEKLKFVSFTVNPDYDTPEVLKKYAQRFNVDDSSWSFVTGKYDPVSYTHLTLPTKA